MSEKCIALLMFTYNNGVLPHPINTLFSLNNERQNCNTRHNHDLQINTGNGELVYKLFSFHGVQIWIHISKKIELIYHNMHALRTYQKRTYKTMIYHYIV